MLTCALVYLVGVRMFPGPGRAVASLLYAVAPWFNVVGTATSQGFYVVGASLEAATWWAALQLSVLWRSRASVGWAGLLGPLSGLALWSSLTAIYFVLPALLWAAPCLGRRPAAWAAYGVGGLVGAAPHHLATVAHHRRRSSSSSSSFVRRSSSFVVRRLGDASVVRRRSFVVVVRRRRRRPSSFVVVVVRRSSTVHSVR